MSMGINNDDVDDICHERSWLSGKKGECWGRAKNQLYSKLLNVVFKN